MSQLEEMNRLLAAMPPVAAMRIRALSFDDGALRLDAPLSANVNDKRCAFGGSLASVMTLAGWGWLMIRLQQAGVAADVYVADSQIRYLAPLYEDLQAEARLRSDQDWDVVLRCLGDRKRARATMVSEIRNAAGEAVATMEARFALMPVATLESNATAASADAATTRIMAP